MAEAYADVPRGKRTAAQQTDYENAIIEESIREFSELQTYRNVFATQWEQVASLVMPSQRNTFFFGSYNFPGQIKTQLQVDATGMLLNWKFSAICDAMITPFSSQWHELAASNPFVQKDRGVRLWFEQVSRILAELRYQPTAQFRRSNTGVYQCVGAFGNAPMLIEQLVDMRGNPAKGLSYQGLPPGQVFIRRNHQNRIDGFCRWFRLTANQAMCVVNPDGTKWADRLPENIVEAAKKNSQAPFDFLHRVCPRSDYSPESRLATDMPFASYTIALTGKRLLNESGYRTFPIPYCSYMQGPDEPYGRGWAMDLLPSLKTLNAQKTTFLKSGHRAAEGVYLSGDDGALNFNLRPGAINPGTMNEDGKPMVTLLPQNPIQITEKMMEEEKAILGEGSLTTIFSALVENPNMTATQVVELINQKGIFLAPMAGSMAPDYLGMVIDRELNLAADMGLLPPMPPLLREAQGEYKVVYTSPLFKAARAGDAAGFLRTVESALAVVGQTQDPSHLDPFSFERAWPEIAQIQSVPESWMASADEVAQKRKARGEAQARQEQIQALPSQAAMLKAQAQVQKAGGQVAENVNAGTAAP